jgi:hypothetical protein
MKRVVVLALLTLLVVSATAWADLIVVNKNGSITIGPSGITSKGSHLVQFGNVQGTGLGLVNFSTGVLTSGSIQAGGTFSSTGSSFTIIGTGKGVPHGVLFSGTFTGTINWTFVGHVGTQLQYQLTGNLVGQLYTGRTVTGSTVQNINAYQNQLRNGIGHITLGTTTFIPEPGTLGLLGTGLVAFAGLWRRKLIA